MVRQPRQHTTTASLCLVLLVTGVFLITMCSARHHFHQRKVRREGGARKGREKDEGLNAAEGSGHPEKDNDTTWTGKLTSGDDRRNVLLHKAVRKLLGFGSSPPPRHKGRALLPDPRRPPPMPKYVMDLYEKYRSGEMREDPSLGNTVRSIPAEIGEVNGEAMFIFNLSSIAATERVLRAHVHLYKRKFTHRKRRSRKRANTELVLYEVAPHYLSQAGSIIMRSSVKGWQWYGATDAVLSCLMVDREHPHLFAVSFRAENPNGKIKTLALRKFVKHHSLPFLILYSNETESVNLEELDIVAERLKQREDVSKWNPDRSEVRLKIGDTEEESGDLDEDFKSKNNRSYDEEGDKTDYMESTRKKSVINVFSGFGRKHHRGKAHATVHGRPEEHGSNTSNETDTGNDTVRDKDYKTSNTTDSSLSVSKIHTKNEIVDRDNKTLSSHRREKRSILTNEIPEDPTDYPKFHYRYNLPQTHPGMLTARKESRQRLEEPRTIPYPVERTPSRSKSQRLEEPRTIPYPAERTPSRSKNQRKRRKHRKRKNRRRNNKNRRRIVLLEQWEDYHDNMASPDNNPGQTCSRRRLVVDFADIGWGDWIISPKSFEAHYCSGSCPFPLTKRLRPSNHATIQSIVNAIGLHSDVPAPCCVPDTMTSVTLLYFDENRNVVLKNYPGMSVQSCACR